ncbi:integrase catalytic domain-containing protein [Trichonephila inaurata madagascariensis]|uniref:Integrase catalytic domain-containing protein n=1 Tax=Trichonephila inaurata madagascariensis TaxID=2747483 RepID=A0A8X6YEW5_9ARAC|nr:integrase catalytic domain-containing protein [Trichonephila inaurata madagascariensis]
MESLKIEYYEILEEEKLPKLELTFDQMEDLESIKVGLKTLLLKHDDISKNVSICDTALSNNDNSKSSFVKLPDVSQPEFHESQNNSTKLRVVFDGSAPTTSGRSLNDILLSGRVQEDVFNIMLRFRKHKIVLTADIKQMFRQILIDPTQRNLLRILWKNKPWEKPIEYELNTVTYGTKSAPFLATRVIKQLCLDESDAFPLAAEITLSDIYMDDIVTGCKNIENAKILKNQLIKMFKTCGMTLHKWNSNNSELLDIEYPISEKHLFAQLEECTTKTLGMVLYYNYIAWINSSPHQLKTFIANRVSKIQALTANYQWKHISSRDNPADLISRGVNPSDLENLEFWWSGPSSAMEEIINDSRQNDLNPSEKELYLTELKTVTSTNLILSSDNIYI